MTTRTPTRQTANQRARVYRKKAQDENAPTFDTSNRRAVLYLRISVDRAESTSIASQEAQCREWCKRNGVEIVVDPFSDEGESAYMGKAMRPNFRQALNMIRSGAANTLVVYKLDRFMRNAKEAVRVRDEIHAWGGSIVCVTDNIDTGERNDNGITSLIFGILAWLAEMESSIKADRAKGFHAMRFPTETRAVALPPGGPRPFGYKRVDKKLVMVPSEAKIIRAAAKRILAGQSLSKVAADLSTIERVISRTGLKHILTSETTAGLRFDGVTHHPGNWKPILERETWAAVTDALSDPSRRTAGPRGKRVHLLSGLMRSAEHPESRMAYTTHRQGPRYMCVHKGCGLGIVTTRADDEVRDYLFDTLDVTTWKRLREAGRGYDPTVAQGYHERLGTIIDMYARQAITPAEFEREAAAVMEELAKVQEAEFIDLPDVENVELEWPTMPLEAKQQIIKTAVSMVVTRWVPGGKPGDRIRFTPLL